MSNNPNQATLNYYPNRDAKRRMFALYFFGSLIFLATMLGHLIFGFETAWAHVVVSLGTALFFQFFLEFIDAWANERPPRYRGASWREMLVFIMPAWIVGNALAILMYPGGRFIPMMFAAALAISSKVIFRRPTEGGTQHVSNPSNFGFVATLLLFPAIGPTPPYHFTENLTGIWDWVVPGFIVFTGTNMHARFTGRLPLVLGWLFGFAAQGLIRGLMAGEVTAAPFIPMTSAAFMLFTLYMIPDPATTPIKKPAQVLFGLSVAATYGLLVTFHVVYGMFIALVIICAIRGIGLYAFSLRERAPAARRVPASMGGEMAAGTGMPAGNS